MTATIADTAVTVTRTYNITGITAQLDRSGRYFDRPIDISVHRVEWKTTNWGDGGVDTGVTVYGQRLKRDGTPDQRFPDFAAFNAWDVEDADLATLAEECGEELFAAKYRMEVQREQERQQRIVAEIEARRETAKAL